MSDDEQRRYEVREWMYPAGGDGWGVYDTVEGDFTGGWFAGHIKIAAQHMADAENASAPCPHCGSKDVDRGGTGLDACNRCGGLFRHGLALGSTNR